MLSRARYITLAVVAVYLLVPISVSGQTCRSVCENTEAAFFAVYSTDDPGFSKELASDIAISGLLKAAHAPGIAGILVSFFDEMPTVGGREKVSIALHSEASTGSVVPVGSPIRGVISFSMGSCIRPVGFAINQRTRSGWVEIDKRNILTNGTSCFERVGLQGVAVLKRAITFEETGEYLIVAYAGCDALDRKVIKVR